MAVEQGPSLTYVSGCAELSVSISKLILQLSDVIGNEMDNWQEEDLQLANDLVMRYLPDSLVQHVGDDVADKIPRAYRSQLVSAILSSRVVYREGYQNLRNMRTEDLAQVALAHLRLENKTMRLVHEIESGEFTNKAELKELLRYGGPKALRELGL